MKKLTICMDVDDVCADLMDAWLRLYNLTYSDSLKAESIKDWDISKFVKPTCGMKIYDFPKDPSMYKFVSPLEGSLEGVKAIRGMGHRVIFVTSSSLTPSGVKYEWLKKHGFEPKPEDYIECLDKSLINADVMFDDNFTNVSTFKRKSYLFTKPWNEEENFINRVDTWSHILHATRIESMLW